jgi:predicted DsbA family dithiol-disulfide isomerase
MAVIEVVSDVICPWCFIGKKRLEKALALLGKDDLHVHWKPFQLNPNAPKDGMNRQEYRARKFGSAATGKQLEDRVAAAGVEEGIHFRFDQIEKVPNTFDSHRLIWLAGKNGNQNALVENLFEAYFLNGEDVGSPEVLRSIAAQSGVDASEILHSDIGKQEVTAEELRARTAGVNGVPTFFVNGAPITSGAQQPEVLARLLGDAL